MALPLAEDNFITTVTAPATAAATTISVAKVPNRAVGYATVFNFDGTQREKIKWTGKTGTIGSAGTLDTCKRGLKFTDSDDVEVAGNKLAIAVGMRIEMTVSIHYINDLIQVINGTDEFPAGATFNDDVSIDGELDVNTHKIVNLVDPTDNQDASTKAYSDSLTYVGAPDGNATTKGIYELATIAEASANAAAGSGDTTAALTITTVLTSNTSSAAQIIPVTDADGDIPVEFMELDANWAFTGAVTASSTFDILTATNFKLAGVAYTGTMADLNEAEVFFGATDISGAEAESLRDNSDIEIHRHNNNNRLLYLDVAEHTQTNSDVEFTIFTYTVPANTLGLTKGLRIKLWLSNVSDDGEAGNTYYKLKFGSTTVATIVKDTGQTQQAMIEAHILADGATDAQIGHLSIVTSEPVTAMSFGTASEDSTGALTISITITGIGNNADVTSNSGYLELLSL